MLLSDKMRLAEIDEQIESLRNEQERIKSKIEKEKSPVEKYSQTYSGARLLKNHSLDTYGIWEIYGEDPNCDFGGSHHQPFLGKFEGKLRNVIEAAVNMEHFYTWGGGGEIRLSEKENIVKV